MKRPIVLSVVVCALLTCTIGDLAMADDKPKTNEGKPKLADRVYVKMETSMGAILIELNAEKAPVTVANFLSYVDDGFYKDTIFHRVIDNFMIQGGGFDKSMQQKTGKPGIANEWKNGLGNMRGTIAMARQSFKPESGTSQFFINVKDNTSLDQPMDGAGYAVFGKVVDGMDVVDRIKKVKTKTEQSYQNVPEEQVFIKDVVRVKPEDIADIIKKAKAAEAEESKKAEDAMSKSWEEAMNFVKSRGADPTKGTKSATGLWHVDLTTGTGGSPSPTDQVKVHYTGWLTNGKKFDSSVDRGTPASFKLNQVIKGWTEGVGSMKVGTKRLLVIPPDLGYGAGGAGNTIPPNATLVFEVELLGINQ